MAAETEAVAGRCGASVQYDKDGGSDRGPQRIELQRLHLSNSVTDELCIIYLAQNLEQFEPEPEDTEQLIIKKLPFATVYDMVRGNEITDSVTVAAVQKVRLMQLEGLL